VLTCTTTLPWLTSILLTDIFAGLAVLALYLIVFGRTVGSGQRWALIGFIGVIRLFRDGMKVPTAAGTVLPRR
jgi:hypothetical protein